MKESGEIDIDLSIYDLPAPGEEWDSGYSAKIPETSVKREAEEDKSTTDKERFDRMYRKSIRVYEQMLDDEEISLKDKRVISKELLEMYGQLGKQKEEKVYNITFGKDYMDALNVAAEAFNNAEAE